MIHLLLRWVVSAVALLVVAYIVPGFRVLNLSSALIAVLIIGFLNMTLGIVLKLITLPLAVLTFGLIFFVIDALILMLAGKVTRGLEISGFVPALVGALVLAIVHFALGFAH